MKNSELLEEAYWKDNSIIMSPFGGGLRGGKLYKLYITLKLYKLYFTSLMIFITLYTYAMSRFLCTVGGNFGFIEYSITVESFRS